jgi:ATP-dependent helicase/nuclease subunit A
MTSAPRRLVDRLTDRLVGAETLAARHSLRARKSQREAADPAASAWVSANAGTGKTQVLTDRILRLLLGGTPPERILALTYTKAAAAEMSKRVFDRLANWVVLDQAALTERLTELVGRVPTADELVRARTLFARAIETPGGLKAQTIHAFAQQLLQRFPLEAGVPPQFAVLDDTTALELRNEATEATLREAINDFSKPLGSALKIAVAYAADDTFDAVLREALARRGWLSAMSRLALSSGAGHDEVERLYRREFALPADLTLDEALNARAEVLSRRDLEQARDILRTGKVSDSTAAGQLDKALRGTSPRAIGDALRLVFLTDRDEPRDRLITSALAAEYPDVAAMLARGQVRFSTADEAVRKLDLLQATLALLTLSDAVEMRFSEAKARRAALDFEDQIERAASLLGGAQRLPGTAAGADWVLYKLDGGLDHILVDEAQDTGPPQWQLIEALANEFFSGAGSRDDLVRTLFAVGDEKQSIYGFQGAAPEMFARKGRAFAASAEASARAWRRVPLNVSFRTTEPILKLVDAVFADPAATPGLTHDPAPIEHVAHRTGRAGLVELWPIETPDAPVDPRPWRPLEDAPVGSPIARLADRIAGTIADWLAKGERLPSEDRPIRPGDILVLVRKRRPFAPAMVAALKARGIAVAGADRLDLADQIAVQDLLVLGDFLVLPEDDLALATVLKSPLFGLDDADLFRIARDRKGSLWSSLLAHAKTDARFDEAATTLKAWRSEADFLPPYEFFASLLAREGGKYRHRLLGRLGAEAADPLDEFINLALTFDESEPPSLQGFLTAARSGTREIKRDMEQGRDEVRVMTVHGAKGLEAPIVFLPDTCTTGTAERPGGLIAAADAARPSGIGELMLWPIKGSGRLAVVRSARTADKQRGTAELNRLLYVALTRPRDRLYIAGFRTGREPPADCWYRLVERALRPMAEVVQRPQCGTILRLASPQLAEVEPPKQDASAVVTPVPWPDWVRRPPPRETRLTVPLTPSRLAPLDVDEAGEPVEPPAGRRGESLVSPGGLTNDATRFLRGTLTHALLEHLPGLPRERWTKAADAFLASRASGLPARTRSSIAREVLAIVGNPQFADVFGPDSQAEVSIVAEIARPPGVRAGPPLRLCGQIDRLAVVDGRVDVIDYKTNRPPPRTVDGVAEAYLLQLATYRLAVRAIFPGKPVTAAILWTDGARIMEIPATVLDQAELRLWALDIADLAAARS